MKNEYFDCPTLDVTCPYFDENECKCAMAVNDEGDPREECDSFI